MDSVHGHPDSANSSPRSRRTDSWGDSMPPPPAASVPGLTKVRLMCSYGGRIVPRPHDKNLCYVAGETRIIALDRQSNLADLSAHISKTLLDGAAGFSLKYQLPHEDLDSLISVTTDEDLENMIEEYDRTVGGGGNPGRLRLFLFPAHPVSAASSSIGSIVEDSKSEGWFVDALNGAAPVLPRLSSDSNSVNCLLGLDDAVPVADGDMRLMADPLANKTEIYSVPESPIVESASFGDEQFAAFMAAKGNDGLAPNPAARVSSEDERRPQPPPYNAVNLQSGTTSDDFSINGDNFAPAIQRPNPARYPDSSAQFASRPVTPPAMTTVAGGDVDQPQRIDPSQPTHQYVPAGAHYFQHSGAGAVPFTPYYIHPQQPPAAVPQQLHQHQYQPVYFIPVRPNLAQHPAAPQQVYPTGVAPSPSPMQGPKPANTAGGPAVQHQYAGYPQPSANFSYQYVDPLQGGLYYTQPGASPMAVPSQYQTVTTAAAMTEGVAENKKQNRS